MDKSITTTVITSFAPRPILIFDEVPLNAGNKAIPHGKLDLLVIAEKSKEQSTLGFLYIDDTPSSIIMGSSVKTEATLDELGSGMLCTYITGNVGYIVQLASLTSHCN